MQRKPKSYKWQSTAIIDFCLKSPSVMHFHKTQISFTNLLFRFHLKTRAKPFMELLFYILALDMQWVFLLFHLGKEGLPNIPNKKVIITSTIK